MKNNFIIQALRKINEAYDYDDCVTIKFRGYVTIKDKQKCRDGMGSSSSIWLLKTFLKTHYFYPGSTVEVVLSSVAATNKTRITR